MSLGRGGPWASSSDSQAKPAESSRCPPGPRPTGKARRARGAQWRASASRLQGHVRAHARGSEGKRADVLREWTARFSADASLLRARKWHILSIMRMRIVLPIVVLVLAIVAGCTKKSGPDPIVGQWVWFNQPIVHIDANGDLRLPDKGVFGHWHVVDAAARTYELDWSNGYVDHVTVSPDGKSLDGANQNGTKVTATRAR